MKISEIEVSAQRTGLGRRAPRKSPRRSNDKVGEQCLFFTFWKTYDFFDFGRDLAKFNQFRNQNDDYSAPQAKILSIFRF